MSSSPYLMPLPPWLDVDERKGLRFPLRLLAITRADACGEMTSHITEISTMGCRIELDRVLVVGRFVEIIVVGLPLLTGWIAWQRGTVHGVDFANPILSDIVARIAAGI